MSHPQVKWAQRKDKLFITVDVVDPKGISVEFGPKSIAVSGEGITKVGAPAGPFSVTLNLLNDIDPSTSTHKAAGNYLQICAVKAASGPHWERLVTEPTRATKNWLSCDWNLWKDEDEEDEREKIDFGGYGDLSNMLNVGGGGSGAGLPDSDDEDIDTPPADLKDLKLDAAAQP